MKKILFVVVILGLLSSCSEKTAESGELAEGPYLREATTREVEIYHKALRDLQEKMEQIEKRDSMDSAVSLIIRDQEVK